MHTSYNGKTYSVHFTDADTAVFNQYTDAPPGVVRGAGEFVFDARNGDLVKRRGSAQGRDEIEWLAFSQDAQEFGRSDLQRHGVQVNPYEFAAQMPELAHNPKGKPHPHVGRRVELLHTTDPSTRLSPGDEGTVAMIDDAGVMYVEWDKGDTLGLVPGVDSYQFVRNPNPERISRTRGVKTMRGPYSSRKGYEPWIKHRGTLGTGFLTTMTKKQREKALDVCVAQYGYRSCLGKIMALERAKRGPRGRGEGVGKKYAGKLRASREYLKKTYGGAGSFGPRKKKGARKKKTGARRGKKAADNPSSSEHARAAVKYLEAGEKAMRSAQEHFERTYKTRPPAREWSQACERGKEASRYALLALHELEHAAQMSVKRRGKIHEMGLELHNAANALLDRLGCPWQQRPGHNPYRGDAVQLAKYRKEREQWERSGRRGPPPIPPPQVRAA